MAKSKEELIYDIENELVDPTTNKITGERVKARLLDMVDAMGTGRGGGAMEYWSFPNGLTEEAYSSDLAQFCSVFKATGEGNTVIWPAALLTIYISDPAMCVGLAFDRNLKIASPNTGMVTIGERLDEMGFDVASFGGVLVTEEEFYTI